MSTTLVTASNGKQFWASANQAELLKTLDKAKGGGIATIHGYRPTTNYLSEHITDLQVITHFDLLALYERKIAGLKKLQYSDIPTQTGFTPELFTQARDALLESLQKTIDGDRSDAKRQAHDRNYIKMNDTVKINLLTDKVNGISVPVEKNGYPIVDSILLPVLVINETVKVQGQKKVVKSAPLTLMKQALEGQLNEKSVGYRTLSLKTDNFDSLKISGILVETVPDVPSEIWL